MIEYKINTASKNEIFSHLKECNDNFLPPLHQRVNIHEYAQKIFENAVKFEAWSDHFLAGFIASYFNDNVHASAYITNVSIVKNFMGLGIASQLLNMCIGYAMNNHFREISLEVHKQNKNAIYLYRQFDFIQYETHDDILLMRLQITT